MHHLKRELALPETVGRNARGREKEEGRKGAKKRQSVWEKMGTKRGRRRGEECQDEETEGRKLGVTKDRK